ncbi:MAG: LytTR family DNA-binding domain-containing protein [Crocinitomicaceae bacterium]|nr:LytTR family DNA-binding domain-containing protein [Crocinitomicaceae bacterium]
MNAIRAIIVDDEEAARDVLQNLIIRSKGIIDIVDQCCDLTEAVASIKKNQPDVVFLDIQMPNYAGYEIASFFEEINFEIIFVTAYDQYAIKAFELSAIDYLVKPINRARLQESIDKLVDRVEQKQHAERFQVFMDSMKNKELGKIIISELGNKRILNLSDIIAIEAKGAYTFIYLQNEPGFLVSKNLKYFEQVLPDNGSFFRSHKSWIIAKEHIQSYSKSKGEIRLTKKNIGRVSRNRIQDLELLMKAQ